MSKKSVEELIGRALTDAKFREKLLASPESTLVEEGYEVGPEVIEAIKSTSPAEVQAVAKEFESQIAQRKAAA
ncbi:Franean1_4349 family RiPP [Polyangium sp. y55x31]|uniref:Franean1_4349 family RiPP n=1 Tax=Polyangium sp. y55x31 TaxID=3042688 RepID=UPI002482AF8B|nr:Franean1_4349 family RiPP [Polyangium sp. y55x31]MDI1483923.1 Franean1_4349 family RiPP [Polyangium sp. y55x31]